MELNWKSDLNASALHTVWAAAYFPEATLRNLKNEAQASLLNAATQVNQSLENFDSEHIRNVLLGLAATTNSGRELAERSLKRLDMNAAQLPDLAAQLEHLRSQFRLAFPKYESEVLLRSAPLQQLWEAYGPGLLHMIGRFTQVDLLVERAEIVLVQPIVGGLGLALMESNRVQLEAVLTNPLAQLPETLRLAWLLALLDLERDVHSEQIHGSRLRLVSRLAMLPAALTAAEELEMSQCNAATLDAVLDHWWPEPFPLERTQTVQIVLSWWETYQAARPSWKVALTGLDQLLLQSAPKSSLYDARSA